MPDASETDKAKTGLERTAQADDAGAAAQAGRARRIAAIARSMKRHALTLRFRRRADGRPASPRPTARRIVTLALSGVAALFAVAAVAWLAILYLPIPASQVAPRVQAALQERLGADYAVQIEDAELQRGGDGVELRLVDLSIAKTEDGAVVASVPRAELRLDGMSLLTGEVKIRTVHVTDPKLDMRFDATVDAASKNSDLPDRVLKAIGDLDRLLGVDGAAGALEQVEVTGATLLIAPRARAPLSLDGVDLRLARGAGGAIALTASSSKSGDRWTSAVTVSAPAADRSRSLDLGLENVDIAPYSAPFAEKAGAPPAKGRISGHFNARIGLDGKLLAAEGRLDARGLEFAMPGPAAPENRGPRSVAVENLQLTTHWDLGRRAIVIDPSQIRGRGGQASFSGALLAPKEPGQPWTADVAARDVLLSGDAPADPPLRLDGIEIAATFDPAKGLLEIGRAQFLGPTAHAALTGMVRFEGASPAVRLGLVSSPMPTSAVKRLWPFFLGTSIRNWVVENVGTGTVDSISFTLDVPAGALAEMGPYDPLPDGSMSLDIRFTDGSLRGSAKLPWIERAKGRVLASARQVQVSIERADVPGPEADGPLAVQNVLFKVDDMGPRFPKAHVTLTVDGALRRALTLVGSGDLGRNPLPQQLDVTKVSGRVTAEVAIDVELSHPDNTPPPGVQITAEARDVRIAGVFAGRSFEKGSLSLKAGDQPTTLTGKGQVGGAPAVVQITETPGPEGAPPRRKLAVTLTADAADLQQLGLDVPGLLKGSVPLSAEISLDEAAAPATVKADLVGVGIDGVVPGFRKPAGRAGRLGFVVERGADKTTLRDFVLESGDRSVRGTIEFGPKGDLLSATLPIYRPGPGDDARVEIDKAKGGVTAVSVQGAALDLKPILDRVRGKPVPGVSPAAQKADAGATPKNLDVTAKLGTGLGYGEEAIAGLDVKLTVRDGKVREADGSGRVGAAPVSFATGEDGRLSLKGGDAGAFFRFADLYGRIDGGAFEVNASLAGGPGLLKIRNFSVRNETALDRVRRTTNADQNAAPAAPAPRGSTRFDRLQVSFVQSPGQIKVDEAVVYGPQIGATMSGTVNYAADRVDLVGTFVPIYALNNLFSRVPIIGTLLGGGKNGGLVGVTFQVKGATDQPAVMINPMSAVAPGFLRKLFEFRQNAPAGDAATGSMRGNGTANSGTSQ